MFGRDYVIDHCVSVLKEAEQVEIYRTYVTEVLRIIAKANGYEILISYAQLVENLMDTGKEEEREPEEIISKIKQKAEALS